MINFFKAYEALKDVFKSYEAAHQTHIGAKDLGSYRLNDEYPRILKMKRFT